MKTTKPSRTLFVKNHQKRKLSNWKKQQKENNRETKNTALDELDRGIKKLEDHVGIVSQDVARAIAEEMSPVEIRLAFLYMLKKEWKKQPPPEPTKKETNQKEPFQLRLVKTEE
jgi:hypothetical protein